MPTERPIRQTRQQARTTFLAQAAQLWDDLNTWADSHPEATLTDLEQQLPPLRRRLMGQTLEGLLSQGDLGASPTPPPCPTCGAPMDDKGPVAQTVRSLEGDIHLTRAYYHCSHCPVGLFPPRPATEAGAG